jgi:phosphatidylglycerol:prolipoprotein diacylglycerol transferase
MVTTLAESYLHRIDPFAIQFTDTFGVRWYGLSYAVGFLVGWFMIRWIVHHRPSPLTRPGVSDLFFYLIVGVLVGGRLGYAVFYEPHLITGFTSTVPFWDLFAISKGGMASHGGMIGVIIACILFARRRKISSLHLFDLTAVACSPGLFFGRIANFINGELWGRPLPDSMHANPPAWSVKYPEEIYIWLKEGDQRILAVEDQLLSVIGGDETFYRNVVDAAKAGDQQVIDVLTPLLTPYWPSQLFQALTDGPLLLGFLLLIWLKPRKPGVIGAWFLIWYGALRIASEVFRQPDEGVAVILGLSRGQLLSVLMILAGAVSLWIVARRDTEKLGGVLPTRTQS